MSNAQTIQAQLDALKAQLKAERKAERDAERAAAKEAKKAEREQAKLEAKEARAARRQELQAQRDAVLNQLTDSGLTVADLRAMLRKAAAANKEVA